jgi:integrase
MEIGIFLDICACSPKFSPKFIARGRDARYAAAMASKRGRKAKDHKCTWDGRTINGLYRKPNGVWRVRATGQEFTEPDERQAVARFEALARHRKPMVDLPLPPGLGPEQAVAARNAAGARKVLARIRRGQPVEYSVQIGGDEFFAGMRKLILDEPLRCARMTGIEWLAYGPELKRPAKAASLELLGKTYFDFSELSLNELSRSKCFWKEFVKVANTLDVTSVDGVNHELAHKYEAAVAAKRLSPKSKLHRYRKVRGILHFNIRRGNSIDHCRQALDVLAMLRVKGANPIDPTPISVDDFWAIYNEATNAADATFATLMLTALNAAHYGGEVGGLRWDEVDLDTGGYVSRRPKTGVSRIAVLWPQIRKAMKKLDRVREQIFCTRFRSYTVYSVGDRFEKYRDAAKVDKKVTFSWIRDAAYSTAMQATSFEQAEMLAGHRLPGTADAYLRRNPMLVRDACGAIRKAFDVDVRLSARTT